MEAEAKEARTNNLQLEARRIGNVDGSLQNSDVLHAFPPLSLLALMPSSLAHRTYIGQVGPTVRLYSIPSKPSSAMMGGDVHSRTAQLGHPRNAQRVMRLA
jgi:hypothetical protein